MSHTVASPWMVAGVDTYQRHAHMTPVPANRRQSLAHETTESPARFAAAASKAPVVDTYQRIGQGGYRRIDTGKHFAFPTWHYQQISAC